MLSNSKYSLQKFYLKDKVVKILEEVKAKRMILKESIIKR